MGVKCLAQELSAFAHMKAGRGINDSGDVSVTTARSARSNN